jgi:Flp pilus assembly protein TadD/ADP-heptose:LPS heptosyltransferase
MSVVDHEAAAKAFRRALLKHPGNLEALVGLGSALRGLNRFEEAEKYCRRALAIRPYQPEALRTLGGLLQLQGRYDDALAVADAAIAARPGCGEAWLTRGDSLANSGRHEEALQSYAKALDSGEATFDALVRTGMMHGALGRPDAALEAFDAALALDPESAPPRYQRGVLLLQLRKFAAGWSDYEARWRSPRFVAASRGTVPEALVPILRTGVSAADLAGRRILLIGEQGVGDQLMFASMIPDLARTAASVVCVCEARLIGLFSGSFENVSFLDPTRAQVDTEAVDMLLAMGSLGSAFRREAQDFPGTAFLRSGDDVRARWAARLTGAEKPLRIGLSWRGGTPATRRQARSLSLEQLRPILDLPDCEFISLQYGDVAGEIAAFNAGRQNPIRVFPPEDLHDFEDLAGLVANLDAVVSVQTAVVHLAGGLGTTCLTLIPHNPEWRYMREGARMPWYGSVQLFRQPEPGNWDPVIDEIAAALRNLS